MSPFRPASVLVVVAMTFVICGPAASADPAALVAGAPAPAIEAPVDSVQPARPLPEADTRGTWVPATGGGEVSAPGAPGLSLLRAWTWGWRGGAGGSTFTGSLADSADGALVSFDAGVFATRRLGWLTFEPQLVFAVRGGNFIDPFFGTVIDPLGNSYVAKVGEIRGSLSLFEARAPLLARLRVAPWFFEPHVLGGVLPAVLVHGSYSGNRILRDFWSDSFRRAGLGWTVGAGTRWPTRYGALTIDFRYEEGGDDVFKAGRGLPGATNAWILGFGLQMKRRERGGPMSPPALDGRAGDDVPRRPADAPGAPSMPVHR